MVWQDIVFASANILTTLSLIPQIIFTWKKKQTTVLTVTTALYALCLFAMTIAMFSLSLWFSGYSLAITGILWSVLCIQSILYRKKK